MVAHLTGDTAEQDQGGSLQAINLLSSAKTYTTTCRLGARLGSLPKSGLPDRLPGFIHHREIAREATVTERKFEPYLKIPHTIMKRAIAGKLSGIALAVYLQALEWTLSYNKKTCSPNLTALGRCTGYTRQGCAKAIKELVEKRFLILRTKAGFRSAAVYELNLEVAAGGESQPPLTGVSTDVFVGVNHSSHLLEKPSHPSQIRETPPSAPLKGGTPGVAGTDLLASPLQLPDGTIEGVAVGPAPVRPRLVGRTRVDDLVKMHRSVLGESIGVPDIVALDPRFVERLDRLPDLEWRAGVLQFVKRLTWRSTSTKAAKTGGAGLLISDWSLRTKVPKSKKESSMERYLNMERKRVNRNSKG